MRTGDLPDAIVSLVRHDEVGAEAGPVRTFVRLRWHDACFALWQAMTAQLDG
jgi:hypothetical protein